MSQNNFPRAYLHSCWLKKYQQVVKLSLSVTGCSTEFYGGEELLRTIQKWERPNLCAECSLHCLPGRSEKSCWNSSWYGLPPPSPRELLPRQNHIPLLPTPCKAGGPSVWVSALLVQRWEGRPSPGPVSWCWGGLACSTVHLLSAHLLALVLQMQRGGGLEVGAAPKLTSCILTLQFLPICWVF